MIIIHPFLAHPNRQKRVRKVECVVRDEKVEHAKWRIANKPYTEEEAAIAIEMAAEDALQQLGREEVEAPPVRSLSVDTEQADRPVASDSLSPDEKKAFSISVLVVACVMLTGLVMVLDIGGWPALLEVLGWYAVTAGICGFALWAIARVAGWKKAE